MGYDRRFALTMFFETIIALSHRVDMMREAISGGGYPLSGIANSDLSRRRLIDRMVNTSDGDSHEVRLNEAGFKMYWRLDQEHDLLKISVGGDQANCYPFLVAKIRRLLKESFIR